MSLCDADVSNFGDAGKMLTGSVSKRTTLPSDTFGGLLKDPAFFSVFCYSVNKA